ncbi:MAG: DUF533 domain-containing protein [Gemmatimonadaceae bacterium]|nr:DUF533 domain-containing protein [Gemmatimonadaceae bacterium]
MTLTDAEVIITIAAQAAVADGNRNPTELAQITAAATRLGLPNAAAVVARAAAEPEDVAALAASLSTESARRAAYEIAVAVCNADGMADTREVAFLQALSKSLDMGATTGEMSAVASVATLTGAVMQPPVPASAQAQPPAPGELDAMILDQAILTAALELLPDRLANMAILPLQLRMVYTIGQRHGQQLDAAQVKDLAATFGIGAAAQFMESIVRRTFGSLAGGVLGGLLGGATGMAAGATVSFTATYALGHAAAQYYAQGRSLTTSDLKALFTRFQQEAESLFPKVQDRVQAVARGTNLQSVLGTLRGR